MRDREAGFSLLEVMVAFTILAVSIGVLMQAFGGGVNLLSNAARQGQVVSLARSQLARVGREWPFQPGVHSGKWQAYRWQVDLQPYFPEGEAQSLQRTALLKITATVHWSERGHERAYTLSTLRLVPAW